MAKRRLSIYLFLHVDASLLCFICRVVCPSVIDKTITICVCVFAWSTSKSWPPPPLLYCFLFDCCCTISALPLLASSPEFCGELCTSAVADRQCFVSRNFRNSYALPQNPRPEPASTSQRLCRKEAKAERAPIHV